MTAEESTRECSPYSYTLKFHIDWSFLISIFEFVFEPPTGLDSVFESSYTPKS